MKTYLSNKNQCSDDYDDDSMPSMYYMNASFEAPLQFHVELIPKDTLLEMLRCAKVNDHHLQHANNAEYLYRLFIAFLIFGSRSCTYTSAVSPTTANEKPPFSMVLRSALAKKRETISYPIWSLNLPSWKASYYFAMSDAKRTNLLESELLNFTWDFRFKHDDISMDFMYAQFCSDHIVRNTVYEPGNLDEALEDFFPYLFQPWHFSWKIVRRRWSAVEDSRYHSDLSRSRAQKQIDLLARKLIYKIQVDQYPVLNVTRRKDGLFQLENLYVVFTQRHTYNQDIIHLL